MVIADTSVWIELLRDSGHAAAVELERLIRRGAEVALAEPVVMELLSGAPSEAAATELRARLLAFPLLPLEGLADFEEAARRFRACRREGETVRDLLDCLVAVIAIRAGAQILHKDRDFDAIARRSDLRVHPI